MLLFALNENLYIGGVNLLYMIEVKSHPRKNVR